MLRRRAHTRAVASGLVALALGATLFFGGMAAGSNEAVPHGAAVATGPQGPLTQGGPRG